MNPVLTRGRVFHCGYTVLHALEHRRNHLTPVVTIGTGERAQVSEKSRALFAVGQSGFLVVDECEQFVAGDGCLRTANMKKRNSPH